MMYRSSFALFLAATLVTSSASAASVADLVVTLAPPSGAHVFENGRYTATVRNAGNRNASAVSLVIDLPATHTSPQVFVMGDLGARDSRCALSGTRLTCNLGTINRGTSKAVFFDIALPQSAAPLDFSFRASTTTAETNLTNNNLAHTAAPLTYALPVIPPVNITNRHCTGIGLTAFFECELFPSSIASHNTVFNADHTITIPAAPTYTGTWTQPAPDRLQFQYFNGATLVVSFDGRGVDGRCFHGMTTFPGSTYVSAYEVCMP